MNAASISSGGFMSGLLKAEMILTLNIIAGLAAGELVLALGIVEKLFAPLVPFLARIGIHGKIAAALLMSLGAPRSGAALISGAYSGGEITRMEATYGALSLAFPGYLRRWVGTAAMAAGIAGRAGLVFALVLMARSAARFAWVVAMLSRRGSGKAAGAEIKSRVVGARERVRRTLRLLAKSLPWAWFFFALTYALVPFADSAFSKHAAGWKLYGVMPAEGWAVAVSSLAHIQAGLSSAAGAMNSGRLGAGQAVLALLIGNMAGSVTRTMRQNVGYWVGIFPKDLVPGLLRWHLITNFTIEVASILAVWCVSEVVSFG